MFSEDAVVFVDADSIYFKTCCVTKNKTEIKKYINNMLNQIKQDCMSDNLLLAVKGSGNFRHDLYKPYKGNRKELQDDLKQALNYAHSHMVDGLGSHRADGMEADDLVSIWAHEAREIQREFIVAGIDKDLLQIPGNHYNFNKRLHITMSDDDAFTQLMLQCLTGDSTDNIPGIKGIGPKKAGGILLGVPPKRQWSRVQAAWRGHKAGSPTLSRRLLEMLKTWDEFENVRSQIESKASIRKQDVLEERKTNEED